MRVIGKKIAVRENAPSTKTASGLFLASTTGEAQFTSGTVCDYGTEVTTVAVGETIHYNKFLSNRVTIKGIEYHIITVDDVLAVE